MGPIKPAGPIGPIGPIGPASAVNGNGSGGFVPPAQPPIAVPPDPPLEPREIAEL
jgi:hypothetical protein